MRGEVARDNIDENEHCRLQDNSRQSTDEKSESLEEITRTPSAHVYVLNSPTKPERRSSINRQLAGSPYKVTWFEAAEPSNVAERCPKVNGLSRADQREAAVFCSNWNLWKRFASQVDALSSNEFLITLEDDVALDKSFWPRVQELLNSPCQNWDYIGVDLYSRPESDEDFWGRNPHQHAPVEDNWNCTICKRSTGEMQPLGNLNGEGVHMSIIRTNVLPQMLGLVKAMGARLPLDHWSQGLAQWTDIRTRSWQPKIISKCGAWKTFDIDAAADVCDDWTASSGE